MGWKTLKERFGILHNIDRDGEILKIGSGHVSDLARVDLTTGKVQVNEVFPNFLTEYYPRLLAARAEEVLQALHAEDTFAAAVPVYTFFEGEIIERLCEKPGYPNTTHDGYLMRSDYSTDKAAVVARAKEGLAYSIQLLDDRIKDIQADLAKAHAYRTERENQLAKLMAEYPGVPAAG